MFLGCLTVSLTLTKHCYSGYPTDLLHVDVKGIPEALKNLTESGATDPLVKATVALSESGFVNIPNVHAYGEIKTVADKIKNMFVPASSSSESETGSEHETAARPEETPAAATNSSDAPIKNTIPLELEIKYSSIPPMSGPDKVLSKNKWVYLFVDIDLD